MPGNVSYVQIDSPVSVGYSVSYVCMDAGALSTIAENRVSFAYIDAGVGQINKALGSVSFTNTASSAFGANISSVVIAPGTDRGFVSYSTITAPVATPPQYDFPIEEGVDFQSSASHSIQGTINIVLDTGELVPFAIGSVSFTSAATNTLSGTVQKRLTPSRTKVIYG